MGPDRAATVAAALAVAALVWPPGRSPRVRRQVAGAHRSGLSRPGWSPQVPVLTAGQRRLLGDAAAGLGFGLLLGGGPGLVAGIVAAVGADLLQRRRTGSWSGNRGAAADLPLACDLVGVCLAAGLPVAEAVGAVASVVGEPLRSELADVAGRYRLGAEPARAWADAPVELAGLARAVARAGTSGSAVARTLRELAADGRAAERARAEGRVRRAGVWLLAPLGACFLPAFLCLGVVPLVLGIAAGVFR